MSRAREDETLIKTTLRLEGPATQRDGVSLRALEVLARLLVEIARRGIRLAVEGRTDLRRMPGWLIEATDVRLTRLSAGSVILELAAPALAKVTPRAAGIAPHDNAHDTVAPSALSVLRDTLRRVVEEEPGDSLDPGLRRAAAGLSGFFELGFDRIILEDRGAPVSVTRERVRLLKSAQTPTSEGEVIGTGSPQIPALPATAPNRRETPSPAAPASRTPAEEWLEGAREGLHPVAPEIEEDLRGVAYLSGTTTKVTEVVLNKECSGQTPEELQQNMPHLSLPQIYAALAYYHLNRSKCEAEIERGRRFAERMREEAGESPFARRMREAGMLR